jgi:glycosyltransferase involved in cell wall biosynthesis
MRVAHLLPNMAIGGRERMVASLCAHSLEMGFEPALICYDPPDPKAAQIACDAPMIQLDRKSRGFAAELQDALASFDIVHSQGHIPAYYLNKSGYTGARLATMHIGMEDSWRWLLSVRQGLRAMDHLTAVSAPMAELYSRISGRQVDLIANGISLKGFVSHHARPAAANEPFRFVMLSRLHKVKRHVDAIAAIDCLAAAGQDVELVIAGEGPETAYLQKCAATRPYLRLVGAVGDIPPFLASHHGLILCSEHEGMPVTLIEAMAVGLPIIACNVGSVADVVGESALLVTPKRSDQLAMAMMRLVSERELWLRLSAQAAIQAPKFDAANMAQHYTALYKQLLMR